MAIWVVKFSSRGIKLVRLFQKYENCILCFREGDDIQSAKVGDRLALRFEIQDKSNSPYEIFVRELIASDGIDASEILLIDSIG